MENVDNGAQGATFNADDICAECTLRLFIYVDLIFKRGINMCTLSVLNKRKNTLTIHDFARMVRGLRIAHSASALNNPMDEKQSKQFDKTSNGTPTERNNEQAYVYVPEQICHGCWADFRTVTE